MSPVERTPAEFEAIVTAYDRRLYNLVLRMVGNREDAADITQESFVRAYRSWSGFGGRSSPYTWLCQIAVNLCKNRARDRARWDDEPPDDIAAPIESGPEHLVGRSELADRVRQAIDELPGNYRLVAVLRDLQGLSYQEIAEVADTSVDVVKTRLARARGMLRLKLESYLSKG